MLVTARFELHPLEQFVRAALVLGAPRGPAAQVLNASGELVAL